jgi:hypothetical protein
MTGTAAGRVMVYQALVTGLREPPGAKAAAWKFVDEETVIGPVYRLDWLVGVDPLVV